VSDAVRGWWFAKVPEPGQPVRLPHGDGRAVMVGETLSVDEPIVLCEHGLHASVRAIDALRYAPGSMVARVELSGHIFHGDDNIVAMHRKTLWLADATKVLQWFAVWCASRALLRERDAGRQPDPRSLTAVRVTTDWLLGRGTIQEVYAAADDATAAAYAAYAAAAARADVDVDVDVERTQQELQLTKMLQELKP
jgi:hypothetical protein